MPILSVCVKREVAFIAYFVRMFIRRRQLVRLVSIAHQIIGGRGDKVVRTFVYANNFPFFIWLIHYVRQIIIYKQVFR